MKNITYKVPQNDREVFLDPAIDRIPDLIHKNRQKIHNYTLEIGGIPFQVLRDKIREELLCMAACYTEGIQSLLQGDQHGACSYVPSIIQGGPSFQRRQETVSVKGVKFDSEAIRNIPIIQTGHEPILYYPGVWIKNHLTQFLARKVNGVGINMIVDNDACTMGFMYVPLLSEKPASIQKVSLVKDKSHMAYEEIVCDDPETIRKFKEEVLSLLKKNLFDEKIKTTVESMQATFEEFVNCMVGCYQKGCVDMVGLLTAARCAREGDLSRDKLEVPVSWMCDVDGFYHFLLHIFYEAERFTQVYNEKLTEYRAIHKIRSKANPLPDLKVTGNLVELPFWIWESGGERRKCFIMKDGESIKVTNGMDIVAVLEKGEGNENNIARLKALREYRMKIRPRAITTTLFSRLFFSDVFIHGMGGAKYDTITDEIIKEFFGVDPPGFITISTTVFLPFETFAVDAGTLQCLNHELKDMAYNPERYASVETQNDREFVKRVNEKEKLLAMMSMASKEEKRGYYHQIKELNKCNLAKIDRESQKKREEIDTVNERLAYNAMVRFREYPICLYPLKALKDCIVDAFSGG